MLACKNVLKKTVAIRDVVVVLMKSKKREGLKSKRSMNIT